MYTKEQRPGYTYRSKTEGRVANKLPFYCPRDVCGRITDSMDDDFLKKYGVCADCYITCVEDRKKPTIDVEYYRERLTKRGY